MQPKDFSNIVVSGDTSTVKEIFEVNDYKVALFHHKCPDRDMSEDALFFSSHKNRIRFGVADGAGGHPRGKDAAFEAVDEVKELKGADALELIKTANQRIIDLKAGAKTTLAFADIIDDCVTFYNVGDSEILYWNSVGRYLYSSTPNSPVGLKVALGIVSQEDSLHDPDRNMVFNLMGDELLKISATNKIEIKKRHTILIGTDGLFDNISHDALWDILKGDSFENTFEKLAQICIKRDEDKWIKDDDIAFILVSKI